MEATYHFLNSRMKLNDFENWKDFFQKKLESSNLYEKIELGKRGDTIEERFVPKNKNDKTEISIGYLGETLIYLKFDNPLTLGFSEQQNREYYYRYDFTPDKSYGNPGLEFIKNNIDAIDLHLENGLNGAEIQFFRNNRLVKSKLFLNEPFEYSTTIEFEKRSFWKSLFNSKKGEITEKRIELSEIFNGLKNKNGMAKVQKLNH